jgi:glycosyltransferase involved in cell wall biosynthesis
LADPQAFVRLVRLLDDKRFDLVHAHGQDATILAAAARRVRRVPLIITRHVLDEPTGDARQRVRARCALLAARNADMVVAVSFAAADWLAQLANIPREKIHVIPNGTDVDRFDRPRLRAERSDLRRKIGLERGDRMILVPAVLRNGKGHEVLLEALPRIHEYVPTARLFFVGTGTRSGALQTLALRYKDAIVFLGQRDDVPELLLASDVVALPSFAEALPTALIEASAAGRPIVASRVGGTPEVVRDKETGLLVPPGDPMALAVAIIDVLTNPAKANRLATAAQQRAREHFRIEQQVDRTAALWSSVVTQTRRSRRRR